jgi:nicotinate-nucleotide pyrophosphorylase (carboxylating)
VARARQRSPGVEIEATGGITLENARAYADAGANFISIGALTHSVRAADIALEIKF